MDFVLNNKNNERNQVQTKAEKFIKKYADN